MANIYCWSGAAGAGTGADWANAYTTLAAAASAAGTAAGDDIWVAHDHAETQASGMTITFKSTVALPNRAICVDRAGSVPPVAADIRATATVTVTGAFGINITSGIGFVYIEGITFNCGSGATNAAFTINYTGAGTALYFKNCSLRKLGTTANVAALGIPGTQRSVVILDNCTLQFGATGDSLRPIGDLIWNGGGLVGSVFPTTLIATGSGSAYVVHFNGVDLSNLGAGTIHAPANQTGHLFLANCKLGASAVIGAAPSGTIQAADTIAVNCDGGDTNYRSEKFMVGGSQVIETTIVRTGGASDGTTPIAWKLVTTAVPTRQAPYESLPITVWNDTTGAKTVSLYGYWNNAAVPTNAQIWMVVEYLGTSGFPQSLFASSGPATALTAGSNIPSDASAWGGGVTTTKFKMSVPITTTKKGPITVRVFVAAASSTFYIDPKIEVI